ncbi:MAG TPA: hypothetical protein VEW28_04430 [Candidatus Kapabacteria bacterium]|nr:hypothetical protein [Candidatus Kapabacteria bacterium]
MRKAFLLLALGSFLVTTVSAYACDGDKACTSKNGKTSCSAHHHTKASKASLSKHSKAAKTAVKDAKQAESSKTTSMN